MEVADCELDDLTGCSELDYTFDDTYGVYRNSSEALREDDNLRERELGQVIDDEFATSVREELCLRADGIGLGDDPAADADGDESMATAPPSARAPEEPDQPWLRIDGPHPSGHPYIEGRARLRIQRGEPKGLVTVR